VWLGGVWVVCGVYLEIGPPRPTTVRNSPNSQAQPGHIPPTSDITQPVNATPGSPGTLPAYIPNRYSTGERVSGEPSRAMFTPSFGSHQSYADYAFSRLAPAGLAGLDEMVSGLRGVAVHLAAGLDTLERRSEV
jgi:hypothetical protein